MLDAILYEVHTPVRRGGADRYSADDVRCKDCTRYDSGHLCHLNECIWLIAEHTLPLHF